MTVPTRSRRTLGITAAIVVASVILFGVVPSARDAAADHALPTSSTTSSTTTTAPEDTSLEGCTSEVDTTEADTSSTTSSSTTTVPGDDPECDDVDTTLLDSSTTTTPEETSSSSSTTTAPDSTDGNEPPPDGGDAGGDGGDGGEASGEPAPDDGAESDEVASGGSGTTDRSTGDQGSPEGVPTGVGEIAGAIGGVDQVLVGPDAVSVEARAYRARPGLRSTADIVDRLDPIGPSLPEHALGDLIAPFPVAGLAHYRDDWGAPRYGPGPLQRTHEGTDIFAARGTPVVASLDGVVEHMTTNTGLGGTTLRVRATDGTYHYYAHLAGFGPGIDNGASVEVGDVLGYVGNTGNARTTPPHLHFEIHPAGGEAVPPVPFLDAWLERARQRVGSSMVGKLEPGVIEVGSEELPAQAIAATPVRSRSSTGAGGDGPIEVQHAAAQQPVTGPAPVVFLAMLVALVWAWVTRPPRSANTPSLRQRLRRWSVHRIPSPGGSR